MGEKISYIHVSFLEKVWHPTIAGLDRQPREREKRERKRALDCLFSTIVKRKSPLKGCIFLMIINEVEIISRWRYAK